MLCKLTEKNSGDNPCPVQIERRTWALEPLRSGPHTSIRGTRIATPERALCGGGSRNYDRRTAALETRTLAFRALGRI